MENYLQLFKRERLTIRQKIGILLLFLFEGVGLVFNNINEYFGLNSTSDKAWFYGFYSFATLITIFSWIIGHTGY